MLPWFIKAVCTICPMLIMASYSHAQDNYASSPVDSSATITSLAAPAPTCIPLGEVINNAKSANPPAAPGNYEKRSDVRAFVNQVSTCYQLDANWVLEQLSNAKYQASAAKFIVPKPAGKRDWQTFKERFTQPDRIKAGIQFWKKNNNWLAKAEQVYGVPPQAVMGILGIETIYGRNTGNYRVIDALATLAFDFPQQARDRSDFFAKELAYFLQFTYKQRIDTAGIKGSYAGAMGMPQFMPSSLLNFGVDFDGDGHIDLHQSNADIIGSVANYLHQHGWQKDLPAMLPAKLNKNAKQHLKTLLAPDIIPTFTLQQLNAYGVEVDTNTYKNKLPPETLFALIKLENSDDAEPDYVVGTQNFYVITRYNRSSFYAAVVAELGQTVAQQKQTRSSPSKWRPQ